MEDEGRATEESGECIVIPAFLTSLALLKLLSLLASALMCLLQAAFPERRCPGPLAQSCFSVLTTIALESTLRNDLLTVFSLPDGLA